MSPLSRLAAAAALVLVVASSGCGGSGRSSVIVFSAAPQTSSVEQLYSIEPSGAGLKQLTTGSQPALAPSFSSNGKRIAFLREGVGIFTMDADGRDLHRLTSDGRDSYPTWSPDGSRIAFIRPDGAAWRLYVVASGGGTPKELAQAPPAGRPSWTRAGLIVASSADLVKVDPDTGRVLKYYGAKLDAIWGLPTVALSPSVSTLTYVGARAVEPGDKECGEGPCQRFGLYLESLTGKRKTPQMIAKDAGPAAFSPDGKQLVFVGGNSKLVLRPLGGGPVKVLSTGNTFPGDTAPPAWS